MTIDISKDEPTESTVFINTNDVGIKIYRESFPKGAVVFIPSGKKNFGTRDYGGMDTKGEVSKTFNFIRFNLQTYSDASNTYEITPEIEKKYRKVLQLSSDKYNSYAELLRSGLFTSTGKTKDDFEAIYMVVRNNEFLFDITGDNTITKENFSKFMVFQARHVIGFPKKKPEFGDFTNDPIGNLRFSNAMIMKLNEHYNDFEPAYYGKTVTEIKNLRHNLLISALSYLKDNDAVIEKPKDIYFLKTEFYGNTESTSFNSYRDKLKPHYVYLGFLYGELPDLLPSLETKYDGMLKWYEDDFTISAAIYVDAFEPEMYKKLKILDHHDTLRETFKVRKLNEKEIKEMEDNLKNMPEEEQDKIIKYLEEQKWLALNSLTHDELTEELYVNGKKVNLPKEKIDELKNNGNIKYKKDFRTDTKFVQFPDRRITIEPPNEKDTKFNFERPIDRRLPAALQEFLESKQVPSEQDLGSLNTMTTGNKSVIPSGPTATKKSLPNNLSNSMANEQTQTIKGHIDEKKNLREKSQLVRLISYL